MNSQQYQQLQLQHNSSKESNFQPYSLNRNGINGAGGSPLRTKQQQQNDNSIVLRLNNENQKRHINNYASAAGDTFITNEFDTRNLNIETEDSRKELGNIAKHDGAYSAVNNNNSSINGSYYTEIFSWGSDQSGQLGLGITPIGKSYPIPRYCTYNIGIKMVSCGEEHAGFITSNNLIYTMGGNLFGQLGINDANIKHKNSPILVEALMDKKPISLSCGSFHMSICTEDGEVYSWGQGKYGALGILSLNDQFAPVFVRFQEARNTQIVHVSCGSKHSAFVDASGRIFTCGNNDVGQLGLGTRDQESQPQLIRKFNDKVKQVACGQLHTLILTRPGMVYSCGANSFGQLGLGNKRSSSTPTIIQDITHIPMKHIAAGSFSGAISMDSGDLYLWGSGVFGEFLTPHRVKTIYGLTVDVSIGNHFGAAINKEGMVYTWGHNNSGELGQADLEERVTPQIIQALQDRHVTSICCGRNFTIALGQTISNGEKVKLSIQSQQQSLPRTMIQSPLNINISNTNNSHKLNEFHYQTATHKNEIKPSFHEYMDSSQNESMMHKSKLSSKSNMKKKKSSSKHSKKNGSNILQNLQTNNNRSRHQEDEQSMLASNSYTPLRSSPQRAKSLLAHTKDHSSKDNSHNHHNHHKDSKDNNCQRCLSHHLHHSNHGQNNHNIHHSRTNSGDKYLQQSAKSIPKRPKSKTKQEISNIFDQSQNQQQIYLHQQQVQSQLLYDQLQQDKTQLLSDQQRDRESIKMLRFEKQQVEDTLWRDQNSRKQLELDIQELRNKLKECVSHNSELSNQNKVLMGSCGSEERIIQEYQRSQEMNREMQSDIKMLNGRINEQESKINEQREKIIQVEQENQRYQLHEKELQSELRMYKNKCSDLEVMLETKKREELGHQQMILQYDDNLKEIEHQFEKQEVEVQCLKTTNQQLRDQLDKQTESILKYDLIQDQLEQESKQKHQAQQDLDHFRNNIYQEKANATQEIENMRRALDDLRYQNEDYIRTIHVKDEEIRFLQKDINAWKEVTDKGGCEISELKGIIAELEDKNRRLNEKLNEVIYNKASAYKQRTLQALRRGDSPERQERVQEYGLPNHSESRLNQIITDDSKFNNNQRSTNSPLRNSSPLHNNSNGGYQDPTQNFKVFQELERIQNKQDYSSQHNNNKLFSPQQIISKEYLVNSSSNGYDNNLSELRREDLDLNKPQHYDQRDTSCFNIHNDSFSNDVTNIDTLQHHHQRTGSTNAYTYNNQHNSPLRSKLQQQQQQLPPYQLKHQTPQKQVYYSTANQAHSDLVKNSCEKLASALGLQNKDYINNNNNNNYNSQNNYNIDNSQESQQQNSATGMTSGMIKRSLHDLRMRLESMKRDKEVVENGISNFELKNQ